MLRFLNGEAPIKSKGLICTKSGWQTSTNPESMGEFSAMHHLDEGDLALAALQEELDRLPESQESLSLDIAVTDLAAATELLRSVSTVPHSLAASVKRARPTAVANSEAITSDEPQFPANVAPGGAPLREQLGALMMVYHASKTYADVRDAFCGVSIALNLEGTLAPAFRHQPKPRPKSAGKAAVQDEQLHRDRLVIDLHWLHCRGSAGFCGVVPQNSYAKLVDHSKPFDFEAAVSYAAEKLTSNERAVEQLGVSPEVQWQLATLKSSSHAQAHGGIHFGGRDGSKRVPSLISVIRAGVGSWALRSAGIRGEVQVYLNLWAAKKMLGSTARAHQIGELAALMEGTIALEKSTVSKKLARLVNNVPAAA